MSVFDYHTPYSSCELHNSRISILLPIVVISDCISAAHVAQIRFWLKMHWLEESVIYQLETIEYNRMMLIWGSIMLKWRITI